MHPSSSKTVRSVSWSAPMPPVPLRLSSPQDLHPAPSSVCVLTILSPAEWQISLPKRRSVKLTLAGPLLRVIKSECHSSLIWSKRIPLLSSAQIRQECMLKMIQTAVVYGLYAHQRGSVHACSCTETYYSWTRALWFGALCRESVVKERFPMAVL